jgi:BirA family transcriptional regulator, biotin operon repressor / biotin---[acetyl-CoA-carboxylase] ligase
MALTMTTTTSATRLLVSKLRIAPAVITATRATARTIITTSVIARWGLIVLLAYRRVGQPSRTVVRRKSATSTQDVARSMPIGSIVVADHQTAGRGRLDRRWESPPGTALLVSFVLRPNPVLSLAAGVAAAQACGGGVRLKWPNDLLLDGAKVGGILVEVTAATAICGIGINLTWAPPGAAKLNQDRDLLLERLRIELDRWAAADLEEVLTLWRALSDTLGRRVRVDLGTRVIEGMAEDIGPGGELIVDGSPVAFGSVTHL